MSEVYDLDTDKLYRELSVPNRILVVYFSAPWCGPCIGMKPIFQKLADAYSQLASFVHVDVAQSPMVAKTLNIHGVPSIAVFREGKLSKLIMGSNSYSELQRMLESELKYLG
ncbi:MULTISPECIES: thioredoxin family protein [Pseudomonas]|uniref:Thioredoxin n=1 Tax=Pseudomonas fluorescens TaxID=294 RepID=A0A5E6X4K3_PSEFL|nr:MULTISPECIES: thioredoxin family protein [Pseudomonas]MBF4211011.1 thioredoxin [Pseudomonas donghuensis]PJY96967.1 thiol reductase thioredoxin [Pseudomonas donghuensis]WKY30341.1 thioredoxin family protein [Pseudomonas donghuensis]VVN35725.1 Thioredoxin 1 [Pseudomonas fluorescens]